MRWSSTWGWPRGRAGLVDLIRHVIRAPLQGGVQLDAPGASLTHSRGFSTARGQRAVRAAPACWAPSVPQSCNGCRRVHGPSRTTHPRAPGPSGLPQSSPACAAVHAPGAAMRAARPTTRWVPLCGSRLLVGTTQHAVWSESVSHLGAAGRAAGGGWRLFCGGAHTTAAASFRACFATTAHHTPQPQQPAPSALPLPLTLALQLAQSSWAPRWEMCVTTRPAWCLPKH